MLGPLFDNEPPEMGMTERLLEERLVDFERYLDLFDRAFPNDVDPINTDNAISAIASFTRSIISSSSRYDQWIQGETSFTAEEEQEMELFRSDRLKCSMCHGGIFFDQPVEGFGTSERHGYFNTGLYNLNGAYPETAQGLIETTGNQNDMGAFRVPTLRNLDATYPWMHDGSEIRLRNIIENYAASGRVYSISMK